MPPAVINCVNLLSKNEQSILTFTNWHGQDIGDLAQDFEPLDNHDDSFIVDPDDNIPGVNVNSVDAVLPGGDMDFDAKTTRVDVDSEAHGNFIQEHNEVWPRTTRSHEGAD
jgi:hypothetical protein